VALLTNKQKKFCDEYLIDFNATQAAIRAGYSQKTAKEQAARLLTNVNLQQYLNGIQQKLAEKTGIERERIIAEYAKLAFFDIRKVLTVDGGLKQASEWDDESAAAIAGLESFDAKIKETGEKYGTIRKIKVSDKRAALDSLCRVLGYNAAEKQRFVDKDDNDIKPITFVLDDRYKDNAGIST
jgi:phage terminase small subunit